MSLNPAVVNVKLWHTPHWGLDLSRSKDTNTNRTIYPSHTYYQDTIVIPHPWCKECTPKVSRTVLIHGASSRYVSNVLNQATWKDGPKHPTIKIKTPKYLSPRGKVKPLFLMSVICLLCWFKGQYPTPREKVTPLFLMSVICSCCWQKGRCCRWISKSKREGNTFISDVCHLLVLLTER